MQNPVIKMAPVDKLIPYGGNARTHCKKQIRQTANSISTFGFINPIIIDATGVVIAGHCRLLAAKLLNLSVVPTLSADHLNEDQRRAYALADNKIALNAGWDKQLLRVELEKLMHADLDFSIETTGFVMPEVDVIVHSEDALDVPIPAVPTSEKAVSMVGDIWRLGRHYLVCGDCREVGPLQQLLGGDRVGLVLTDPPFNVFVNHHVSGLGATQHREFVMASGEMSQSEFIAFLAERIGAMVEVCRPGALLYLFMDWRHLSELQQATDAHELEAMNLCVWVKSNGGMGSMYRSQHELVWVVKKPGAAHINNVELGRHGRYRTNVWQYAGMNSFGRERDEALRLHPTVKPLGMIRDAILDASHPGDWVLDSFLGSGTTLLAAEQTGRRCLGVELDPAYVDVALERWQTLTGQAPHHLTLKMDFQAIRERRADAHVEA